MVKKLAPPSLVQRIIYKHGKTFSEPVDCGTDILHLQNSCVKISDMELLFITFVMVICQRSLEIMKL